MVFIVPEGPLHLINFAGLPSDDGAFLIEKGWTFHYLSSARDVVRYANSKGSETTDRNLLALGAVDYGPVPQAVEDDSKRWRVWDPLPETAREIPAWLTTNWK